MSAEYGDKELPYPLPTEAPDGPGAFLELAQRLTVVLDELSSSGLHLLVPTVSGTGATVDENGKISLTSLTSVAVDDVFTADYDGYLIDCDWIADGSVATLLMNLRSSGSDDSATNYDRSEILVRNGTVSSSTAAGSSSWALLGTSSKLSRVKVDLSNPALALPTTGNVDAGSHSIPAAQNVSNLLIREYLTHRTYGAYDGFKFTFNAAVTGSMRVYGFRG